VTEGAISWKICRRQRFGHGEGGEVGVAGPWLTHNSPYGAGKSCGDRLSIDSPPEFQSAARSSPQRPQNWRTVMRRKCGAQHFQLHRGAGNERLLGRHNRFPLAPRGTLTLNINLLPHFGTTDFPAAAAEASSPFGEPAVRQTTETSCRPWKSVK
jgi:hypothetical protein